MRLDGRTAAFILLVVCVGLALSLVAGAITFAVAGPAFAAALAVLGLLSRGFRRHRAGG